MTPRSTALRTAWTVSSMLLSSAAIAAGASAQSLPATGALPNGALPNGGVDLETGPDGVKLGLDAGDTGGVTVGAGENGVGIGLRTSPKSPAPPAQQPGVSEPQTPNENSAGASPGSSAPRPGAGDSIGVIGDRPAGAGEGQAGSARNSRNSGSGGTSGSTGNRSAGTPRLDDLRRAARTKRDNKGAVAPVFDLVEKIPAAVRAGLLALAMIALAMWALWVRGRRRLQHNAYLDPDTDVANMAAFEQVLEREWQRATRYGRPMGLVLLELQDGPGGRLLGERDARDAVDAISPEIRDADLVARLAPSRFAVVCPEAPQGSIETLAHAIEHRLEERRLRCWAGFAERNEIDERPADLVARAATALAQVQDQVPMEDLPGADWEPETAAFPEAADRMAAA